MRLQLTVLIKFRSLPNGDFSGIQKKIMPNYQRLYFHSYLIYANQMIIEFIIQRAEPNEFRC